MMHIIPPIGMPIFFILWVKIVKWEIEILTTRIVQAKGIPKEKREKRRNWEIDISSKHVGSEEI